MIPLYTEEEFKKCKSRGLLPLKCEVCSGTFYKQKHYIQGKGYRVCSKDCQIKLQTTTIVKPCGFCGKETSRQLNQFKGSKSGLIFCNSSCSAKYGNRHKSHGTRVSKLEVWLSQKLTESYPQYEFQFNKIDAINAELDIYIPAIKLAFELNGIYHYEPIYGEEKLKRVQNNDKRKFQACLQKGIALCSIDTSSQKRFTEKSSLVYLEVIKEVIEKHLDESKQVS